VRTRRRFWFDEELDIDSQSEYDISLNAAASPSLGFLFVLMVFTPGSVEMSYVDEDRSNVTKVNRRKKAWR